MSIASPSQDRRRRVGTGSRPHRCPVALPLDQSLLIAWPQVTALVALTVLCFGGAYVAFMRQEIRA